MVVAESVRKNILTNEDVYKETQEYINRRRSNPTNVWGYSWGFEDLDYETGGIQWEGTSEMTVIAARPAIGKSAFGIKVALHVAAQFHQCFPGLETRIILLEMEPIMCYLRIISQITGIGMRKIQRGFTTHDENQVIDDASAMVSRLPIRWIRGRHDVEVIGEIVATEASNGKRCGFWMLDHVGIIPTQAAKRGGNASFAIGEVSTALFQICRTYAPGLILCQLNRDADKGKDKEPGAEHVYGSDRILQDTDNLIILHRPEKELRTAEEVKPAIEVAFLYVAKQRNGPDNLKLPVGYMPSRAAWNDLDPDTKSKL